jgi:hypothetical protein
MLLALLHNVALQLDINFGSELQCHLDKDVNPRNQGYGLDPPLIHAKL